MGIGLNVGHAMGAITVGNVLICAYICLILGPGWKYHLGFSVSERISFGIYGSILPVLVRIILSIVLYGAQSWLGGLSVVVLLSGMSKQFLNMKNTFPASVGMSTRDFIGFLLFQLIQMSFLTVAPHKLDMLLVSSCAATFVAFIAMLILCIHNSGNVGPLVTEQLYLTPTTTERMWLYAISIWIGALSPDIMNQNDFSRYSKSPSLMNWGVVVAILAAGTFVPLTGLLCASATKGEYGYAKWMPTEIIIDWLHEHFNTSNRVIAITFGFIFLMSQLSFNVVANGFAGGMGMAGICPKYINIKRGAFITAVLSWVVHPWSFYGDSSIFLDVMSSMGVITIPIIAISVADFLWVRHLKIPVLDLYTDAKDGTFFYWFGLNWRAILVWVISVALGLPGLISNFGTKKVPRIFVYLFQGNAIFSFVGPFVAYILICYLFPVKLGQTDVNKSVALPLTPENGPASVIENDGLSPQNSKVLDHILASEEQSTYSERAHP